MNNFRRLKEEEAQELIKVSDDFTNSPSIGFTLTPSTSDRFPASDGWEDVTYYTNRSKTLLLIKSSYMLSLILLFITSSSLQGRFFSCLIITQFSLNSNGGHNWPILDILN